MTPGCLTDCEVDSLYCPQAQKGDNTTHLYDDTTANHNSLPHLLGKLMMTKHFAMTKESSESREDYSGGGQWGSSFDSQPALRFSLACLSWSEVRAGGRCGMSSEERPVTTARLACLSVLEGFITPDGLRLKCVLGCFDCLQHCLVGYS